MKIVTLGEIMLRFSSPEKAKLFQKDFFNISLAGSEANAAVDLSILGEETEFITVLPNNDLGDYVIQELNKHAVKSTNIIRNEDRLGTFFLETGANQRASKVIYDRENTGISKINSKEFNWEAIFKDCKWFHISGITPALSIQSSKLSLEAVKIAKSKNIPVSIDLNYRGKLWNYGKQAIEVMPEIVSYADVIIGNEEDAQKTLGVTGELHVDNLLKEIQIDQYKNICKTIVEQFPNCKQVALSLRESFSADHNGWSSILYDGSTYYPSKKFDIKNIVDRVGAGDSFAASLIYGLLNYKDKQVAIDFATAASCIKHSIIGDFNLTSVEEVKGLLEGNSSGRIKR